MRDVDSQADGGRERADSLGEADLLADADVDERVADPDRDADQAASSASMPGRSAVPPVRTTSPMPSEPGWFW